MRTVRPLKPLFSPFNMSYSPFYGLWIGWRGMTLPPGVFQELPTASSKVYLRSSAIQNSQGNLFPIQDHLSHLSSSSLEDNDLQDKDRDASDCLSDILWGWLSSFEPPLTSDSEPVIILSEGVSQISLDRTPLAPCSPSPTEYFPTTMQSLSRPSSSIRQSTLSPMDEALLLPSRACDTIDNADICLWILNNHFSSVLSGMSPPPTAKSPRRPPRPADLDNEDLQSFFGQWIESEENERRSRSEGEREILSGVSAATQGMYSCFPRSMTAPSALNECFPDETIQDELADTFSVAMSRRCVIGPDGISEGEHDVQDREGLSAFQTDMHDMDFFDVWTPPQLQSPSSSSTLDRTFHLSLLSPSGKEGTDDCAIWESSQSQLSETSNSPGFRSSSPFDGWSSVSPIGTKSSVLNIELSSPFDAIALHQPQPIRPIPPIPIPMSWSEFSEPVDVTYTWAKDAISARITRGRIAKLSPPNSPITRILSV